MRAAFVIVFLGLYAIASAAVTAAWMNDLALWTRVMDVSPTYARGAVNLGAAYAGRGNRSQAVALWWHGRTLAQLPHVPRDEGRMIFAHASQNLIEHYRFEGPGYDQMIGALLGEAHAAWPESFALGFVGTSSVETTR